MGIVSAKGRSVGRVREFEGRAYPSVTTILSWGIAKPNLPAWAVRQAADYVTTNLDYLSSLSESEVKKEIIKASEAKRDAGGSRGSRIHKYIEKKNKGEKLPSVGPDIVPYINSYLSFHEKYQPKSILSEAIIYNDTIGYSGGVDAVLEINGKTYIVDFKAGNRVYADVALQLSAYAHAEFYVENKIKVPFPMVENGAVLHITPDGYEFNRVDISDWIFNKFLAAKQMFDWSTEEHFYALGGEI